MPETDLPPEVIQRQLSQFSKVQLEILYLKCRRKKNIEIGNQLGYAPSTIADYVGDIYQKLSFDPKWHWTQCRDQLEKHYCETITAIHEGKLPAQPVPEPTPPQPSPVWLTVVEQEERDRQAEEDPVNPPLRTIPARPHIDLPRLLEFLLVVGTCAFVIWAVVQVVPNPLAQPAAAIPTSPAQGFISGTGNQSSGQGDESGNQPTPFPSPSARVTPTSQTTPDMPAETVQQGTAKDGILYANQFAAYPAEIIQSGKAFVVNGQLVAQTDVQLVIGEETWTDYVVSFQMTDVACKEYQTHNYYFNRPIVGLRLKNKRMVGIMLCTDLTYFATNDPNNPDLHAKHWTPIPYSNTEGASGPYEVQVTGNTFRFSDMQISVDGYAEGKVFFHIPEGVAIRNLVIKAIP